MIFSKNLMDIQNLAARWSIKFHIFDLKITLGITVFKFLKIYGKTADLVYKQQKLLKQ